ncbi:nucleoside 2-deoxyribosyltransferase [Herbaspirillum rubrisubalbicans]|uniref:Nucleoside 2-deoxyribosyltransferase n=1 Tax=Herbaspirillum rubrisubalbicans TaxID=80842 RepID=A0AAD0XIS0_9BURK|nr:nucleoside 2-deoxyribosyltransferase [Herbaspirillum rubrisubalbicans]ALU90767.1 Nucleoside 2-deoxyribosyltransferase protein [Herbaspirillum rubrisubalbicans M1]AYR25823.1 nucleoside 2-deoxyribosyltransferase [Herbaspirillum rubrisubalbicans]
MTQQPRIYLAGPDVFQRDYAQYKLRIKQWCTELGLVALCPGDDEVTGESKADIARRIYEINVALIESADYVVANVRNFRGHEPDSGTVFEIGYAVGRGKKVWCYNTPTQDLLHQLPQGEPGYCLDGMLIEDFGLPRNLMLAHAAQLVQGDLRSCLQQVARWHGGQR